MNLFCSILIVDFCKNNQLDISTQTNLNRNILCMSLNHNDINDISQCGDGLAVNIPMNKVIWMWNQNRNLACSNSHLPKSTKLFFFSLKATVTDYVAVFHRIIMPIGYEFNPELVLVSADFDVLNTLCEANNYSADLFGYCIYWLSALANGKIIIFTKGDSNVIATASCIKTLLGIPLPTLNNQMDLSELNIGTIQNVISGQQKYWKSLKFNKMLPRQI